MLTRAHVVLVTVPWADDVQLVGEVVTQALLLGVEPFHHAIHQLALADRAAGMHAAVLPGVQPTVQAEDADLGALHVDDHSAALEHVLLDSDHDRAVHGRMVSRAVAAVNMNSGQISRTGLTVSPLAASANAASMSPNSYRRISFSTGSRPWRCSSTSCGVNSCGAASPSMTPLMVLPPLMTLWTSIAKSGMRIPTSASVPSGASAAIAWLTTAPLAVVSMAWVAPAPVSPRIASTTSPAAGSSVVLAPSSTASCRRLATGSTATIVRTPDAKPAITADRPTPPAPNTTSDASGGG